MNPWKLYAVLSGLLFGVSAWAADANPNIIVIYADDMGVGDVSGLADCVLVPQMYAAARFGVETAGFTKMNEIYERCSEHPAFIKAHPDNQPDAVKA